MNRRTIFFLIFAFVIVVGLLFNEKRKKEISKNHIVLCSEITSCYNTRGGIEINFLYDYKGKTYHRRAGCKVVTKKMFERGENKILIVTSKNDPVASFLLEDRKDFAEFNIQESDTVNIVCN